jgi:plasmid stability protein
MTQQQLLQNARNVLVGNLNADHRHCLRVAAAAHGRSAVQVRKASTLRLALWVSKGTSAI